MLTDMQLRVLKPAEKIYKVADQPAVQARDIVLQVYRFVQARGLKVANPAEAIRPSAIATFKPRDRALTHAEIHVFFRALERTSTMPTLRLAIKFMLLTVVRKSEFIQATWDEVDFDAAVWTIPKERMKAARPHRCISESAGSGHPGCIQDVLRCECVPASQSL